MLVNPAAVVLSVPDVSGVAPDEVGPRVAGVVAAVMAMGPAARAAATGLLSRLVWHRRQRVGSRLDVTELCPEYLVVADGTARSTAHRVWAALRPVVGWVEVGYHTARAIGVEVRRLREGIHRHGRFLALTPEVEAVARAAAGLLGAPERADGLGPGVVVRTAGSRAQCPWHDDHRPSLTLSRDGTCRCYACGAAGRWSSGPDGVEVSRFKNSGSNGAMNGGNTPGARTTRTDRSTSLSVALPTPPVTRQPRAIGPAHHVVRVVTPGSVSQSTREGEDLIGLLVRIDRYHAARVGSIPPASCMPDSTIPDRYVTLDQQVVTERRLRRFGRRLVAVPSAFAPVPGRWVMLDYDDAADAPIDVDGDPRWWGREAGPAVERALRAALPGEVTGRVLLQRSGLRGVHVLVETSGSGVQWADLVATTAPVVHRWFPGAVPDPRARGANRCIRAPGLRRLKAREGAAPFVVRVAYASP